MAERVARSSGAPAAPTAPPPPDLKHCWVSTVDGRVPGLLLGWERREAGWFGRAVHPAVEDGAWVVVEQWVPAPLLEPA